VSICDSLSVCLSVTDYKATPVGISQQNLSLLAVVFQLIEHTTLTIISVRHIIIVTKPFFFDTIDLDKYGIAQDF
jgi:hypothetical protein